jgi:cytochrome P450
LGQEDLLQLALAQKSADPLNTFVQEMLRMRGDVLIGNLRKAERNVQVGPYIISKGRRHFPLLFSISLTSSNIGTLLRLLASSIHENREIHGDTVDVFDPTRWRPMSDDIGDPFYNSNALAIFGSGFHACPGRRIALAGENSMMREVKYDRLTFLRT